eukprot:TRINITY_DN8519_c0_g1_i1.p1 TRINITY_DN8519_c0_g1~~TRINITY_DN8519_c0_g1_i1.p1  ORF type:complete len:175 (-),score=8.48 TRINITY_DN8519_c0_g1_i1:185-709(-)
MCIRDRYQRRVHGKLRMHRYTEKHRDLIKIRSGIVHDIDGSWKGKINSDGTVLNQYGARIGSIEANCNIVDRFGFELGSYRESGEVANAKGELIGYVNTAGFVMDLSGRTLAYVEGKRRIRAGATCFFFKFSSYQMNGQSSQQKKSSNSQNLICLLYTSPSPRDLSTSRMPSSA